MIGQPGGIERRCMQIMEGFERGMLNAILNGLWSSTTLKFVLDAFNSGAGGGIKESRGLGPGTPHEAVNVNISQKAVTTTLG